MEKKEQKLRLKEILVEKHMNGSELARRLGVSPAYVNAVMSNRTSVSIKRCVEIAQILDVPLASLFDGYCKPGYVYCPHCGKPITISEG